MALRRMLVTLTGVAALAGAATGAVASIPATTHTKSVQVSKGAITIARTVVSSEEVDYDVALTGPLAVHGWRHTGTLHGTSVATVPQTLTPEIPEFSVVTDDGVVTGDCGGSRSNPADDATSLGLLDTAGRPQFRLNCDLSYDGSPAWHVAFTAQTKQSDIDADHTDFSGTYVLADAETTVVGLDKNVTYGDAQLRTYSDDGGGQQLGPLHLSGQVVVGSQRYVGDLVSAVAPYTPTSAITDLPIAGSNGSMSVSGTCSGDLDGTLSEAESTYDLTCPLSVNGAAAVSVPLRVVFTGSDGRCSGRQCWTDQTGYVTSR